MATWIYHEGKAKCMECGWQTTYEGEWAGPIEHICEPSEGVVDPFFDDEKTVQTMAAEGIDLQAIKADFQIKIHNVASAEKKPCKRCGQHRAEREALRQKLREQAAEIKRLKAERKR